jgi:muconolactone delta-isomerase
MRRLFLWLIAVATLATTPALSAWPERPATVVVPYPPGGNNDILARPLAPVVEREIGRSLVIDNRGGGGGTIGAGLAARAQADDYTLLFADIGILAIAPHLYAKLPYEPDSFEPIIRLTEVSLLVAVPRQSPHLNVAELLAAARTRPDAVTFATPGNGTAGHLAAQLLMSLSGTRMVHVPYRGSLGGHGLWAKRLFYEDSARVPTILLGPKGDPRTQPGAVDRRLVQLADMMPTLLNFAGVEAPESVEGLSMVGKTQREVLLAGCRDDASATRMATDGRYKLIWYPTGNTLQLFDLEADPQELHDRSADAPLASVRRRLEAALMEGAWSMDLDWIRDGKLVGAPAREFRGHANRGLSGQRGHHFPPPPVAGADVVVRTPG